MRRPVSKWALLALLFAALLAADQWTKYLAVERLTVVFERGGDETLAERVRGFYTYRHLEPLSTEPYYVWRPVWRMNYVENPGAAWGLFRGHSQLFRNAFFTLVSLAAVAFILHYYRKLRQDQRYLQVALALVLAGAVGNFVDRLARRYVIDFVEWYWWNRPDLRWPTFNVADSLIVVGVAMLVLHPGSKREAARAPERRGAAAERV
ncbi:lipoprotein signal peptidase [Anaeromyxobacter sp. K]|uniref:Lipoprotein signal peptidase n=1 Tax=Anaeromyxobacter dehalogenans (strain ATCC BAA-258 / DSM 21875 / 2CP-1) TaxID=455488 RepID=B8J6Z3_ANAD2|nr:MULTISPECIES: signal peptidase II [Anaeromyxobacter]ACG71256.1 lipoprotein signal peptidase [Anaeromyxobacter sp. K]ACL63374.1 lipoprotein signal peptidase [Anaeromyxobacter dehalogenans 2CP-1]